MKNKWLFLRLVLVFAWLISSLACGIMNRTDGNSSNPSANNSNSSANNNAVTVNKRDPKIVCAYLPAFITGEYKNPYGSGYSCINTNPAKTASGRPQNYGYVAYGDAENIERVNVSILTNVKYADAAEGDEGVVQWSNELWQKIFAAPLPNEMKEAILTNKGKGILTEKKFTEPANVRVTRRPGNGGTYTLNFELTLPK